MARKRNASPADVRAWAIENGFTVGTRGLLPPDAIKAFNKAHKNTKYTPGAFVRTVEVKGVRVNANGRKTPVRKQATYAEIREAARAAGVDIGTRGRLSAELKAKYAAGELTSV